jgi:hypothetical protein
LIDPTKLQTSWLPDSRPRNSASNTAGETDSPMSSVSSLPDRGKGVGPLALDFIERAALGAGIIALHLEVSGDDS